MSVSPYHCLSRRTTCGVLWTPLFFTASLTAAATFCKIAAASLEPFASSAAGLRSAVANIASRRKNGSFHRSPSPLRLLLKSNGTRRPNGQCSSDFSGCKMRSTSSKMSVPDRWNSFIISPAIAPSFLSATISAGANPPASETRSLRLRYSLAPSNRRPNVPRVSPTCLPSIVATDFSAVGVVTTIARALLAFRSASSGAGVSGVNRSNRSVKTLLRTTPANAERRHPRENSKRLCGTTWHTSMSFVASMNPSNGHTTVVLPSPMSICAHSAPPLFAAFVKSRTRPTCRSRRIKICAYSNTSMRGSYVLTLIPPKSPDIILSPGCSTSK
eukprot:31178-Pelagococcus_subviridis.AAC.11